MWRRFDSSLGRAQGLICIIHSPPFRDLDSKRLITVAYNEVLNILMVECSLIGLYSFHAVVYIL